MKIESRNLDAFGIVGLCFFSLISGYNQVVMKVVNDGLQPVFCAGLRSLFAAFLILIWLFLTKKRIKVETSLLPSIIFYGLIFGAEFMFLHSFGSDLCNQSNHNVLHHAHLVSTHEPFSAEK